MKTVGRLDLNGVHLAPLRAGFGGEMKKNEKPETRGGKRPNSGRKTTAVKSHTMRVTEAEKAIIIEMRSLAGKRVDNGAK